MSFEFGSPLPAAEMRLKCCGTQVLDCKGVYCSAHNAEVPSGIRDSDSVGPGQTRIRPGNRRAAASAPPPMRAAVAGTAALLCSDFLGGGGFLWRRQRQRRLSWRRWRRFSWRRRRRLSWRRPGGLASVVLLVGGAGPVIVLVILAAGAGVAGVAAGFCDLLLRHYHYPWFSRFRIIPGSAG